MKRTMSIHFKVKALAGFVFVMIIIYLAGSYFGGVMLFLMYGLLLLPLLSIAHLLISVFGIKYFQYFSSDHPVKGETIRYRVVLTNESFLSISKVSSHFVTVNPLMDTMIEDFHLSLSRGEKKEFVYEITCSYRGIYNVGLDSVTVADMLDLVNVTIPVWHRTFYVYPRILTLSRFFFGAESLLIKASAAAPAGLPDSTLVRGIREYREPASARHIFWKKFAATGLPVLKEYDTSATPEVALYIDLSNEDAASLSIKALEREDVSIEILTALVRYYLKADIRLTVTCHCNPIFTFKGDRLEAFDEFYRTTINLFSGGLQNPYELFRADISEGRLESKSVIFITHRITPGLFDFLEESINSDMQILVIFNHTTTGDREKKKYRRFFNTLRDRGANIVEVHSPHSIIEDMEGNDGNETV
ncbi:MAG: DUF58 domain-containing protein [Spirochaetales bacterium]|nr:DUF58 domain-containing protein [Spirochaetales bacterium]